MPKISVKGLGCVVVGEFESKQNTGAKDNQGNIGNAAGAARDLISAAGNVTINYWPSGVAEEERAQPTDLASEDPSGVCPYKGLEYFDFNDEDPQFFFGREALTAELLEKVRGQNFLALVGASGNGKSSVLRAGLLHELKLGQHIPGSEAWRIRVMRPDKQPLQNLALTFIEAGRSEIDRAAQLEKAEGLLAKGAAGLARLVRATEAPRTVLVVDQFEEAFTRCEDIAKREAFFACLIGAIEAEPERLCLVLAMRADFVGKCLEREYSGLARRVEAGMKSVLPLRQEELKAAICKPAERMVSLAESGGALVGGRSRY